MEASVPPLDAREARVLGVLIEKALATPAQYPLSVNALAQGCSQKSNRQPVLTLGDAEVRSAAERLRLAHLAAVVHAAGSRVERWRHNAAELLRLSTPALAVLAELLLRGPQQPGELRSRAARMAPLADLTALEAACAELEARGILERLPPPAGGRAALVGQRLAPGIHSQSGTAKSGTA